MSEMEELVTRLRIYSEHPLLQGYLMGMFRPGLPSHHIVNDIAAAAAELESLRASLTRVEEETLAAIEPFIRHGRSIENERNLRIWTDRGYREVPREDFDRLSALKARLSRATSAEGK